MSVSCLLKAALSFFLAMPYIPVRRREGLDLIRLGPVFVLLWRLRDSVIALWRTPFEKIRLCAKVQMADGLLCVCPLHRG